MLVRHKDMRPVTRHPGAGFTLIEILAVTTIIAALATLAFPRIQDSVERAKIAKAIGDIEALETDIDSQDSLPPNLVTIGRDQLMDPWGNPYVYYPFPSQAHGVPQ